MEKAMALPNVPKKIDNFSGFFFFFLKNDNEINRQEQNTSLNPNGKDFKTVTKNPIVSQLKIK